MNAVHVEAYAAKGRGFNQSKVNVSLLYSCRLWTQPRPQRFSSNEKAARDRVSMETQIQAGEKQLRSA